jgi:hypothetical protein
MHIADHLRTQIAAALRADDVTIFFDDSRERTIAIVRRADAVDVFLHDSSSDDDDFAFYAIDPDLSAPACIPAFFVAIPDAIDDDADAPRVVTLPADSVALIVDAIDSHVDSLAENAASDAADLQPEHVPAIQSLMNAANALSPSYYTMTATELLDLDLVDD